MDDDRRRNNPRIPALANWHSSYIDAYAAGEGRARHRRFFEQWPRVIGGFTEPTTFRVETLPHFKAARENLGIAITEPTINPDTGSPVISMAYPIRIDGKFGGAASANITLNEMSKFLDTHKASANSITLIIDQFDNIIAYPVAGKSVRRSRGVVELANVSDLDQPQIVQAVRLHKTSGLDRLRFESEDKEYVALFTRIPDIFFMQWDVVVVTPLDDFVGALKQTNRKLIWLMSGWLFSRAP